FDEKERAAPHGERVDELREAARPVAYTREMDEEVPCLRRQAREEKVSLVEHGPATRRGNERRDDAAEDRQEGRAEGGPVGGPAPRRPRAPERREHSRGGGGRAPLRAAESRERGGDAREDRPDRRSRPRRRARRQRDRQQREERGVPDAISHSEERAAGVRHEE